MCRVVNVPHKNEVSGEMTSFNTFSQRILVTPCNVLWLWRQITTIGLSRTAYWNSGYFCSKYAAFSYLFCVVLSAGFYNAGIQPALAKLNRSPVNLLVVQWKCEEVLGLPHMCPLTSRRKEDYTATSQRLFIVIYVANFNRRVFT